MLRRASTTPCPDVAHPDNQRRPQSILGLAGDSTTDIDFTTEFRASLLATKPRRRQSAFGVKRGTSLDFAIHEDRENQDRLLCSGNERQGSKKSILAQPPQRPRPRVSFAPVELQVVRNVCLGKPGLDVLPPPCAMSSSSIPGFSKETIKKPARRGTIYIPSDDTTMPSVHMGIFSPIQTLHKNGVGEGRDVAIEFTGLAAQMAQKRGPRKSLVAAPAKRVPLQKPLRVIQDSTMPKTVPGKNTGKENLPPGHLDLFCERTEETQLFDIFEPVEKMHKEATPQVTNTLPRTSMSRPTRALRPVSVSGSREGGPDHIPSLPRLSRCKVHRTSIFADRPNRDSMFTARKERIPTKLSIPEVPDVDCRQQYPLLCNDLSNSSMYEDGWLAHQEVAITQLVNNLFTISKSSQASNEILLLRLGLLDLYQDPAFSLLYKRVQASLLYGALSLPKDVQARGSRLWSDLGMRRHFSDLWLNTYNLASLRAGLEVVVGRECTMSSRGPHTGRQSDETNHKISLRAVRIYIETFLIRNEDANPEPEDAAREAWSYQRTLLRSLTLIKLLDTAKGFSDSSLPACLFLPNSLFKTSAAVVQALAQMLHPAVGDILRSLNHLDYFVNHKQFPLEEIEYHITNLAVDLRDGVRLTRIVELLLYPSASHLRSPDRDCDATTTITMPGGEALCLLQGEHDWPLSQHLKFPCLGRATKVYNVQVALSALKGVSGMEKVVADLRAEDVVDGFREKTVALLWALTGKWGLGYLIDWVDVRGEIRRLSRLMPKEEADSRDEAECQLEDYKGQLKAWASAVAESRGLHVRNLTTSFADGKVFEAVVDEYERFLPDCPGERMSRPLLQDKLARLGCSMHFAKLFAPPVELAPGRVFDQDFTLAALAFLCSRLLSASKRPRAAVAIQRAWRRTQERLTDRKRCVAKRLAMECRSVVITRERLLSSKATILRFWRRRRHQLDVSDVVTRVHQKAEVAVDQVGDAGDIWLSL